MLENVIETTEYCRHCLMCRHVDPVGNVTHNESLTPHGWGQLVASERRGMIRWSEDAVDRLFAFADNGNCRIHCVTSQPLPEAIAAVRAEVVAEGLAPDSVYALEERLREWENPYEEQRPEGGEGSGKTALFVGDATRFLRPAVLEAVRILLEEAGVDPVLIGRGRNSGFLASSIGLPEVARDLAEANLAELVESAAERLLVLSPEQKFAFGQMYEERLGLEFPDDVELVEVVELLADRTETDEWTVSADGRDEPYAYLDPTHAVRLPGRHAAPRRLLDAALSGDRRELFWRKERAHPCGNLALGYTHPEIAEALTGARLEDAREVGARMVVTEDPGTLAELYRHVDSGSIRVESLYELLAEC